MITQHDTLGNWYATHPLYVARYGTDESYTTGSTRVQHHHSLIQEIERNQPTAVDAVYAARHAELPPEIVAYLYDESDENGPCFGWRLVGVWGAQNAEEWWYEDVETAVRDARQAVERAVGDYDEEV